MCRAVLRSMCSSGLNVLTSAAILVSKCVVSKRVIRPTPETPSTRLDQTVSMSMPIGVMKPMPVTATRRPLDFDSSVIKTAYGRRGQSAAAPSSKTPLSIWTWCRKSNCRGDAQGPLLCLEKLLQIQGQLEAQPRGRRIEIAAQQLLQLLQPVQHGVTVQAEGGRRALDRTLGQVSVERLQQLAAVADLGVHQPAEAVVDEPLGQPRVLGQDEVRDDLVVAVHQGIRAKLAPRLDRLLCLEEGARDAVQAWVVAADAGPDARAQGA